jgi:Tol biopolymer transport system component
MTQRPYRREYGPVPRADSGFASVRILAAGAFVLVSALVIGIAAASAPAQVKPTGRIAFCTTRDGNAEIYIMNADGSGQTRLTKASGADSAPALSPDGKRIAFSSERDGGASEVYVMNADGSGQARVTKSTGRDDDPSWSPDGARIASA